MEWSSEWGVTVNRVAVRHVFAFLLNLIYFAALNIRFLGDSLLERGQDTMILIF